jgi:D-alanine-D-alanine ligase
MDSTNITSLKVLVLGGGDSPEREVSLRSAQAVYESCKAAGYENTSLLDPSAGMDLLIAAIKDSGVVLPIMHGEKGEDGWIQKIIEAEGKPFLGATSQVSEVTIDKVATKNSLPKIDGVNLAKSTVVSINNYEQVLADLGYSYVLKPITGGSSIDTYVVRGRDAHLAKNYSEVFGRHKTMMAEELIEGIEITVPIFGDKALEVIEIIAPEGAEFDYTNKYNGKSQELCPSPNVPKDIQDLAKSTSLAIHNEIGVRHLSRVDFIWSPDMGLYFLEINTIPGLTKTSLYPKSALVAGMDMPTLVDELIKLVLV